MPHQGLVRPQKNPVGGGHRVTFGSKNHGNPRAAASNRLADSLFHGLQNAATQKRIPTP